MNESNLKFLYKEYKNCMKNEFSEYFGKDDEYKSYVASCYNQKKDIINLMDEVFNKVNYVMPSREESEVLNKYSRRNNKFKAYGWTGEQVKNYFLNYDHSQKEYDVWTNQIMTRESDEYHGIFSETDKKEIGEERLPELLKKAASYGFKPDIISAFKWTGKPIDQWNAKIYTNSITQKIHYFS